MKLSMPEELLLLMLDDRTGRLHHHAAPAGDYAIAGALLAELALARRIDTDPQRLWVTDSSPVGDDLLDGVLAKIDAEHECQCSQYWIQELSRSSGSYRDVLFGALVRKGVLRQVDGRFLWVFAERRYPSISGNEEREVKARLLAVLFNDDIPEPRDALLIGLCRATQLFSLFLSEHQVERIQTRIDRVADLEELNRSLSEAIREIYSQIKHFTPV